MKKILLSAIACLLALSVAVEALSANSAVTVNSKKRVSLGNKTGVIADITIGAGTYPSDGVPLSAATLGLQKIEKMIIEGQSGYVFEYDYTNETIEVWNTSGTPAIVFDVAVTHTLIDTDTSADGTLLYVHTMDGRNGMFVSEVSDNADSAILWSSGVYAVVQDDDDPDTFDQDFGGGAVYAVTMDDIGTPRGLTCNNSLTGTTIYVPLSDGQYAQIQHAASGDTAVYFDAATQKLEAATGSDTDYSLSSGSITAEVPYSLGAGQITAEPGDEFSGTLTAISNVYVLAIGY